MEGQNTSGVEPVVELGEPIAPEPPRKKRRLRRFVLWSLGLIVVVVGLAAAIAPTAAGWVAPGMASDAIGKLIRGSASVERVKLSWFGSQQIGPVVVKDEAGIEVARVEVSVSRGLWGLGLGATGLGGLDTGEIAIAGKATAVREADGTINLARVFKTADAKPTPAPAPPTGEPIRLPRGLAARLVIDKLDLTLVDKSPAAPPGAAAVRIANIKGGGEIAAGKPATFKLTASAWYGPSASSMTNAAGTLAINATVDRLLDSTSRLTPDIAKFDVVVEVKDASLVLADAFAGTKDALAAGFGERLTLAMKVAGTPSDATADLTAEARGLSADVALRYADSVLTAPRPGTLRVQTAGVVPLVPAVQAALRGPNAATVNTWPEVSVGLQSLRLTVPRAGAPADLRGGSLALTVKTTELLGSVMAPTSDDSGTMARRALRLAPLTLTVNAPDLAGPVKVHADTAARLSDESAGNLQLDVTADGLLDAKGAPVAGPPRRLNGRMVLKEIATALAQPIVEELGLDLPRDLGPRLDIVIAAGARTDEGAVPPGGADIPRTDVDVTIRSGKLQSTAALVLDDTGIRGRDKPDAPAVQVSLASAAQVAARLANRSGVARASGQGPLTIAVSGLHVPLTAGTRAPDLINASASAKVAFGGLTVQPVPARPGRGAAAPPAAPDQPLEIERFDVTATLAPGRAPGVAIDSALAHAGNAFAIKGGFAIENLWKAGAGGLAQITPDAAMPVGQLTLTGVPTTLAAFAPSSAPQPGQPALDLARLVRDAVGPAVTVSLETSVAEARADRLNMRLGIDSQNVKGRVNAGLLPDRFDVARSELRATLAPALAQTVLAAFAPAIEPRPRLTAPATLVLAIEPTRVPFLAGQRFAPDLAAAGDLSARITQDGMIKVENLALKNADGSSRDIGPAALDGLEVTLGAPIPTLVAGSGKSGAAAAVVKATLLAGSDLAPLGRLDADAKAELASGAPDGPATANVRLTEFVSAQLDRILAQPGLLAGALGPTVSLDTAAEAELVKPGSAAGGGFERIAFTVTPGAAKLKTERPLKATLTPERISVDTPMVLGWTMDPAFGDRFALGIEPAPSAGPTPPPSPAAPAPNVRFASPSQVRIALYRLGLATGDAPMNPGIFAADAAVEAPAITFALADGSPARFDDFKLRVQAGGEKQEPGTAGLSLRTTSGGSPVEVTGAAYGLHDESGRPTPNAVRISARAEARSFPTALVDALARQRGLLNEALGPTMTIDAEASGVGLERGGDRGKLSATFSSPRATAKLDGGVNQGVFVAHEPVSLQLVEITPGLGQMLVSGLPTVGSFQKRPEDGPAVLTATNLRVPVDGDLRKLNGEFVLNLGQVRFDTSESFSGLLRRLRQRDQGTLGRRVAPFKATFTNGVMKYDKYTLPLGEFSVDISGEVDFAQRTLDVLTYVPLGELTDEAAGLFNTGLGRLLSKVPVLDNATMLPFRTHGPFGKTRTEPDVGAFVKELNPLNILKPPDKGGG